MPEITTLRNLAIIVIFTVLFGTAAFDKIKTMATPEWFVKQFANTFIAKMPGGAATGYWLIAFLETFLALAFIVAAVNGEFIAGAAIAILPYALCGALFLFSILCFGLRIAYDFQGSANMFIYFAATLISLYLVRLN